MELNSIEIFWIISIISEITIVFITASLSKNIYSWFQPPVFLGLIIGYYTVGSTISSLLINDFSDRGIDLRDTLSTSLLAGFIFYTIFVLAYFTKSSEFLKKRYTTNNPIAGRNIGRLFNTISIVLLIIIVGFGIINFINPFGINYGDLEISSKALLGGKSSILGPFTNYGALGINFLVPGNLLLLGYSLKTRKGFFELIIWLALTFSIYITIGFRYRLFILLLGMSAMVFITKKIKFRPIIAFLGLAIFAYGFSFLGSIRRYGYGVKISEDDFNFLKIVRNIFSESRINLITGKLISMVPEQINYVGIKPIINIIKAPIPAGILDSKDNIDYIRKALVGIYDNDILSLGASYLLYGEFYLMGGWLVLITSAFLMGYLYRLLWIWFNQREEELLAQVVFITNLTFLYVLIHRASLVQAIILFSFTVLPVIIYYYKVSKPLKIDKLDKGF